MREKFKWKILYLYFCFIYPFNRDLLCKEDLQVINNISKDFAIELNNNNKDNKSVLFIKQIYKIYNLIIKTN
jgi:hypothetical protein